MDQLTTWLHGQSERERRAVFLEDALLSNRFSAYAFYRLRFFLVRFAAEALLQAVRFLLLYRALPQHEFIAILLVHALAGLTSSAWWGALEVMRGRVRQMYRAGKPHLIAPEIGRWLSLSLQLASAALILGAALGGWQHVKNGLIFNAADLYVLAVFLRLALDLVVRCYHSGIYAIRRIYRPPSVIVLVELVTFLAPLALWPWLGIWSLPLAAVVSSLIVAAVTLHYTRRLYRFFSFGPSKFLQLRRRRNPFDSSGREGFNAGAAYALMHLDALLVLGLFVTAGSGGERSELFVLFFLIGPAVRAGLDWAQLFYFDLKRLEGGLFRNLKRRFETLVFRLAWVMALVFWAVASIVGTAVLQRNLGMTYGLLIPFFLSRSLLATAQIHAFSERAYGDLLKTGLLFPIGLAALGALPDERLRLLCLSGVAVSVFGLLCIRRQAVQVDTDRREPLWPCEWLARVRGVKQPIQIWSARLANGAGGKRRSTQREKGQRWMQRQLGEQIAGRVGRSGAVTVIEPDRVVWYEQAGGSFRTDEEWLFSRSAGIIESVENTGIQCDGLTALETALARDLLGKDARAAWRDEEDPPAVSDVERVFTHAFPQGVVFDPHRSIPPVLDTLASREKRVILFDALDFVRDFKRGQRRSRFDVTALAVAGELRLIFLIDGAVEANARSQWRRFIKQVNLRTALGPLPGAHTTPRAALGSRATAS